MWFLGGEVGIFIVIVFVVGNYGFVFGWNYVFGIWLNNYMVFFFFYVKVNKDYFFGVFNIRCLKL